MSRSKTFLSFSVAFFSLILASQAVVPPSETFKYVNDGEFGPYVNEYDANYRTIPIATFPFQFCFYNTTPNAYILGLRLGSQRQEPTYRWLWDANRGRPVRENATLTFGSDGNLVLADADGKVAWQTGTANKGVVRLDLLPNGNLVLLDNQGKFVWQSFDYPTDTLFVGQSLRTTGPNKLVSRLSVQEPVNGPYSLVIEKYNWAMYYQPKNLQKPLVYYRADKVGGGNETLKSLDFYSEPESDDNHAFNIGFRGTYLLARPKYNSTLSFLRVDIDGNVRIYTYDPIVDYRPTEITFVLFDRAEDFNQRTECGLPRRCGALGVCEDNQCVACPKPQGLLGWSKTCAPPVLQPCKGGVNVDYYKVDGVEHYTSAYDEGKGPLTLDQCKSQCSSDCKCLGVFYRQESSKCLLAPDLGSLIKVDNSSHVGYIKISK